MRILVTGGAGFIGSNLIYRLLSPTSALTVSSMTVVDKLTYAGNLSNISYIEDHKNRLGFIRADICDLKTMEEIFRTFSPEIVFHLAAETHVDNSIENPMEFVSTNVLGTANLLRLSANAGVDKFIHVSTDEVYGSLGPKDPPFTEMSSLRPSSPYSASKAGSDLLAISFYKTYGLPVIVTRCSNNYGPRQHGEKLIPRLIYNALHDTPLPLYGKGDNIRDWIHVDDHCSGIIAAARHGLAGEVYNFGGATEITNLGIADRIISLTGSKSVISYVIDRPGHDFRYAIDFEKSYSRLGWRPCTPFEEGIRSTIGWYIQKFTKSPSDQASH